MSAIKDETRTGGVEVHFCENCNAWSKRGQPVRHAKRCETPNDQPALNEAAAKTPSERRAMSEALSAAKVKRLGRGGSGLTADEAFEAQQRGYITASEAMNRDD